LRSVAIWILESGTARLLDLLRQPPGFAVALNAQRTRHNQSVFPGRVF